MVFLKFFLLFTFLSFPLLATEEVLTGHLIGSGQYLETENGNTYPLKHSDLAKELMEISGKKVRMLCELYEDSCEPKRYEIAPFRTETNLPKWTVKQIPKYVFKNLTAFNPTVTPDGHILFWTVLMEQMGQSTQKIWYSELDEHGFWRPGKLFAAPLNNKAPSAVIAAMPGGNELFVFGSYGDQNIYNDLKKKLELEKRELLRTSSSPQEFDQKYALLKEEYKKNIEKIQNRVPLYKSAKEGRGWSFPKAINFPEFYNLYRSEENPMLQVFGGSSLSSSGRVLIYSAQHKDNLGKLDLYVSMIDGNGTFPLGVNLGKTINTANEEMAPFLASDDRTLYFSSNGHNGLSIYVSQRVGNSWTEWSTPKEISKNLKGVNFFSIPASGNWAYVSKQGSLLMTYLPREVQPDPVILVKGKVTDNKGKPISAAINFESLTTKEKKGATISDPNTGTYSIVLPYGDNYGIYGQADGHIPAHKHKDLRELGGQYKEVEVDLVLPKLEVGEEYIINNLFFDFNKSEIKKESEPELDRLGDILIKNPSISVLIEGHTDNIGRNEDNLKLSLDRASAVADYLNSKHKVDKTRLKVAGHGEEFPLVENDSADNRAKNRRVVFKIIKKSK
ncbi:MAG: OmpA family protein [Leptospiraceae bacterium]|nr:OmpA family protein [Leptospiraceae bacterium]